MTFTTTVRNTSPRVITLPFPSAQRFDVVIAGAAGELTRWSTGRTFAQVFRQESWLPGETSAFSDTWTPVAAFRPGTLDPTGLPAIPAGLYRIWAELPTVGRPLIGAPQGLVVAHPLQLTSGCTQTPAGLPGGEWIPLLPTLVQPVNALASVWRYDAAHDAYTVLSLQAAPLSDLVAILPGDLVSLCTTSDAIFYQPW